MKKILSLITFCTALAFTLATFAHPEKLPKPWTGNIHFGYVANSGNSRDTNGLGKIVLRYKHKEKWEIGGTIGGQFSTGKTGKTAQRANLAADAHYYFIPRQFTFSLINYQYDQFSPYLYTTLAVLGYGWELLKTKRFDLTLKAGPGIRYLKESTSKKVDKDLVGYTEGLATWHISNNVELNQVISYEYGNSNAFTQSKTSLITKIIGNLSFEASFALKHYSKVPKFSKNKYKTDTITNLALVYEF